MNKRQILIALCFFLMILYTTSIVSAKDVKTNTVTVDGKAITLLYGKALIKDGQVLVPLRDLLISLGVSNDKEHIDWNVKTKTITILKNKDEIKVTIEQSILYKNGSIFSNLEVPALIISNRTYLPVKEVSEALGFSVTNDLDGYADVITSEKIITPKEENNNSASGDSVVKPTDKNMPLVVSAKSMSNTTLEVVFDEELDILSAETASNYSIMYNDGTEKSLIVSSAKLLENKKSVVLTASSQAAIIYNLTISNVKDISGNVIDQNKNTTLFGGNSALDLSDSPNLILMFTVATSNTSVQANYNKQLDKSSAENIINYTVKTSSAPFTQISVIRAELLVDKKTVKLTTSPEKAGDLYQLIVSNVKDINGVTISPESNSGSFGGIGQSVTASQ